MKHLNIRLKHAGVANATVQHQNLLLKHPDEIFVT
jgi:hypothetical protein